VNSAAISPIKDHVILGGGQEAIEVYDYPIIKSHFLIKIFSSGYSNFRSNR
jgi:hypothetical protein